MNKKSIALALVSLGLCAWIYMEACAPVKPGVTIAPPPDVPRADPKRLEQHVKKLAEEIGPRNDEHPEGFRKAADYIEAQLQAQGLTVERQPLTVGRPPFTNLVARVGPEGPRLIVGAHYDSFSDTAGADDNASGVAGLLELARLLQKAPSLGFGVELVAYGLEEPPHFRTQKMGSAVHASSVKGAVLGMISLEMIGCFTDEPKSQRYPSRYLSARFPDVGNFIVVIGRREDQPLVDQLRDGMSVDPRLPVYGYAAPVMVMGIDFSDHLNYWAKGHKAVMVTDTAFFRSDRYHTHKDTVARLDYQKMALVVDGVFSAINRIKVSSLRWER